MQLNKDELLSVLTKVKPGLSKKAIVEQFTHFIFTGNEITTYNDDICICHPYVTEFKCSVKAEDLYKLLTGISTQIVDITVEEGKMYVKADKTRAGLATVSEGDAEEHIKCLSLGTLTWSSLPQDFVKGLFLCMFSASSDMTHGNYTCVFVEGNVVNSADGLRLSRYTMESEMPNVLIPARNVVDLISFDVKEFSIADAWAHFKTDEGVIFSSRIKSGDYLSKEDRDGFFKTEGKTITLPSSFKELVESVSFMTEGAINVDKTIEVRIKDKKIMCKAEKEIGWIEKEIDFDFENDIILNINPIFLTQILEKATTLTVQEKTKALFVSDKFEHVMSLAK